MQNALRTTIPRRTWLLLPLLAILSACAPSSGIFSSNTWQAGTLQHEHIRSIAVDPKNSQNIYAGDMQNGVFVSSDGGTSWKQQQNGLPPGIAINALVFDDSGKHLDAATDAGIYTSADGAKSWTKVAGLPQDKYTAIAFDLNKTRSIYVGSAQHGVFASQDSGATWAAANTGLPGSISINGLTFDSDAHQLWAGTSMGIYRSPDGGASWQALNTGLPANINVYTVLPASTEGGTQGLIYTGTNKGFYLSRDSAAHWQTSQASLGQIIVYDVLIDYHTVSTVYIATNSVGVLRSLDNGESWEGLESGLPHQQPVYAMAEGATDFDQLFAASNNIYLNPGTGSIFDPTRLLPFVIIIAFFYLLIRMSTRKRNSSRAMLKPERIVEPERANDASTSTPQQATRPENKRDNQDGSPEA